MATSTPSQTSITPEENSAAGTKAPAAIPLVSLRAVLLILFCMLGNYWLNRHVGIGFDGPNIGFLSAGAGIAFALVDAFFGDALKKGWVQRVASVLLDLPVLVGLWAVLLLGSLVCSSLTIIPEVSGGATEASITRADGGNNESRKEDNKEDPKGPVHFYQVWTTPLGTNYRVSVPGYLTTVVPVYPITGATIIPSRDLKIAPSVLFRPPEGTLGPMGGTVRVEAYETKNGQRTLIAEDDHVGAHSIMLGYQRSVPLPYLESWRMEAVAEGIVDQSELAKLLQDWKTPFSLRLRNGQLEPGTTVELIVYSPGKKPMATGKVLITMEPLQDVRLESVTTEPLQPSSANHGGVSPQ